MNRLINHDFEVVYPFFKEASVVAAEASCHRAKCGSVIVKDGVAIGRGYNSPANHDESQRMCNLAMNVTERPKYDKTCCVHAEWRAILEACKANPDRIIGSTLYFMRVDSDNNFTDAGEPFCTTCSRLALDAGVGWFALYNNGGADVYELGEYNHKSYEGYINE